MMGFREGVEGMDSQTIDECRTAVQQTLECLEALQDRLNSRSRSPSPPSRAHSFSLWFASQSLWRSARELHEAVVNLAASSETPPATIPVLAASDRLSTDEAAEFLGVHPSTLESWRFQLRDGAPPYEKVGQTVYYQRGVLEQWRSSQPRAG